MFLEGALLTVLLVSVGFLVLSFVLGEVFDGVLDFFDADDGSVSPMNGRVILVFMIFFTASMYISVVQGLDWWWALPIGFGFGLFGGFLIFSAFRSLSSQQGSSHWNIQDTVGLDARVSLGIDPGRLGQVDLSINGEPAHYAAQSIGGESIPSGTVVTVDSVQGDVLIVQTK